MAAAVVERAGVNVPAPDLNGPQVADSQNYLQKYRDERDKRIKASGTSQYIDLRSSKKYSRLLEDPWIASGTPVQQVVPEGGHVRALIVGAGYGALQNAVHLIKAGFKPEDAVVVDPAGGFGGTWYWNRYPGLMCDVESYICMPFLEDFPDYMPSRKYVGGEELRQHADNIATKFGLHQRAMFQTAAKSATWDDDARRWKIEVEQKPKGGSPSSLKFDAEFVIINAGVLSNPKLPDLPGIEQFAGHSFHTSRWDWSYTGGNIVNPDMTNLRDKRVGIIGTGATAVQIVPKLAKYAKELYVFQRTPSAVDERNNRDTDANKWKNEIAAKSGWQRDRSANFHAQLQEDDLGSMIDMVEDGWTHAKAYRSLSGFPNNVTMDTISDHVSRMNSIDYPRQERIRQRAMDVVKNPETAEKLKAWYPTWCKRPCFHDEYLPAFNSPNVHLVDTDGQGVDRLSPSGVVYAGKEYPLDVLIWATGFQSTGLGSPAEKCNMTVIGRDGLSMAEKFKTGLTTLHGTFSRDFPNCFWCGPSQTSVTPNFSHCLGVLAEHIAYIISTACARYGDSSRVAVEPTAEAEEAYAQKIMGMALAFAPVRGCTPSYMNKEGETDRLVSPEERMAKARLGVWGQGIKTFEAFLEEWREEGGMKGVEIRS